MKSATLLVFLALVGGSLVQDVQGAKRQPATGYVSIPCQAGCPAAATNPRSPQALPADCAASATADLPARWALPQYPASWSAQTRSERNRGPHPRTYDAIAASQVPSNCNPLAWAWARVQRVITDAIALDINYCHHHAPSYVTPASGRNKCGISNEAGDSQSKPKCVCSSGGMGRSNPWRGVDCSNLSSFIFNLGFGFYPTSDIGMQACHPSLAPGRLLPSVTTSRLDLLQPGDLLFITTSKSTSTAPVRVSHVVMWTGWTVDFSPGAQGPLSKAALMANLADKSKASTEKCMQAKQAQGQPVYVIADSHFNGPALRPFCGWYVGSFSHARRVIQPDPSLPTNDASIASYDASTGDCMSRWALQN